MWTANIFKKLTAQERKQDQAQTEYYKLLKRLQNNRLDRIQKEDNERKKVMREEYLTK